MDIEPLCLSVDTYSYVLPLENPDIIFRGNSLATKALDVSIHGRFSIYCLTHYR